MCQLSIDKMAQLIMITVSMAFDIPVSCLHISLRCPMIPFWYRSNFMLLLQAFLVKTLYSITGNKKIMFDVVRHHWYVAVTTDHH